MWMVPAWGQELKRALGTGRRADFTTGAPGSLPRASPHLRLAQAWSVQPAGLQPAPQQPCRKAGGGEDADWAEGPPTWCASLLPDTGLLLRWHGHRGPRAQAHPRNRGDEEQSGRCSHSPTNPSDRQARWLLGSSSGLSKSPGQSGWAAVKEKGRGAQHGGREVR